MKRKTTWGQQSAGDDWVLLEDRVSINQITELGDPWYRVMSIIHQSRRSTSQHNVCYMATSIPHDEGLYTDHDCINLCEEYEAGRVKTMSSKVRKELEKNAKAIQKEDTQVRSALTRWSIPWFAVMVCLLPFKMSSWFVSKMHALKGFNITSTTLMSRFPIT